MSKASEKSAENSPPGSSKKPAKASLARALAENIECLAIAIVMALILKFFLLEAYKIPTGSMQPTIMGLDRGDVKIFDRVLVNKMIYYLREPERFEVVVFKMPLSQRQNYIKRLLGLPGEQLRIRNGDVYVTPPGESLDEERIARKPDSVWDSMRLRVLPADSDEPSYRSVLRAGGDEEVVLAALLEQFEEVDSLQALRSRASGEEARTAGIHLLLDRTHLQDQEILDALGLHESDKRTVARARSRRTNPSRTGPDHLADLLERLDRGFVVAGERLELQAGEGSASFETIEPIKDATYHGYGPTLLKAIGVDDFSTSKENGVSDLELSAELTPSSGTRAVQLQIRGRRFIHTARFDLDEDQVEIHSVPRWAPSSDVEAEELRERFDAALPRGEATEVRFRNLDDQLVLIVDGDEVARIPYETTGVDPERLRSSVVVRCDGGTLELEDFEVHRDIYYTSEGGYGPSTVYEVPEDAYFVMGDNTQASYDCRQWQYGVYELEDGKEVSGIVLDKYGTRPDANPRLVGHSGRGRRLQFRNIHGQLYEFDERAVKGPKEVPFHYVPAEFLLGKALAVFWPLPPFAPTWRLRLIR